MASSSRSRQKRNIEPITIDELMNAPGMSGFVSFLKIPPKEEADSTPVAVPATEVVVAPEVKTTPGVVSKPKTAKAADPVGDLSTTGVVITPVVEKPGADAITPGTHSTPGVTLTPVVTPAPVPKRNIRRCVVAQDGHTLGEEALYQSLWNNARPENRESRVITVGWRGMSALCRLTPKNCKLNAQRLIRKLAIEVIGSYNVPEQVGTTYRVYSYGAILERRRAAGLEWVIRSRGVEFVDPTTGVELTPGVDNAPGLASGPGILPGSGPEVASPPGAPVKTTPAPGVEPTTQLETEQENNEESSSALAPVIAELRCHGPVDDEAARQLVHACRSRVPDASLDEILAFIRLKAGSPGVRKPLGFLLTAVPRCFEGESFRQFRAEAALRRAEEFNRQEQIRREVQAVLDDPASTEDEKRWAREVLDGGARSARQ